VVASSRHPRGHRVLLAVRWLILVLGVLALPAVGGCARQTRSPSLAVLTPPSRWPSDADYGTLASARATVRQALTERDWRRKAGAAEYGLLAMMTLHAIEPGPCASLVAHTYAELMDLHDAYRGENWNPMVAVVRSDPSLASRCRPRAAETSRLRL
jgi:hypothetical protein